MEILGLQELLISISLGSIQLHGNSTRRVGQLREMISGSLTLCLSSCRRIGATFLGSILCFLLVLSHSLNKRKDLLSELQPQRQTDQKCTAGLVVFFAKTFGL
jgi:hypothetical protein